MNKKKLPIALFVILGVIGTILQYFLIFTAAVAVVYAIAQPGSGNSSASVIESSDILSEQGQKLFEEVKEILTEEYMFDQDDVDFDAAVIKGYVDALGDPYTVFYTPEEYEELTESMDGSFCGIGVTVQQNAETKVITVLNTFKTGPARAAGVQTDDIITGVDGEDIQGQDVDLVVSKIRGDAGTDVTITVYRPSENKYIDITITRAVVQQDYVDYELEEGNIGYITLNSFADPSCNQLLEAYNDLKAQGAEGLIIDIRNNGGGLVTSVCDILDAFLPKETILTMKSEKTGEDYSYYSTDDIAVDESMPIVILVNENSASASEIFCGTMQVYGRAEIIGTQTFGKGIVQTIYDLDDGYGIKVTTAYYYLPDGNCIHEVGVTPDQIVENDAETEEDEQYIAAYEYLQEQLAK